MWRWRVFYCCGGRRAWGIRLVGGRTGDCLCWGVSCCSGAWRFPWEYGCGLLCLIRIGEFVFDGLAGGSAVSRAAAEFAGAGVEERVRGVVDGVDAVRAFAHYEFGISELAVRDS